jgi:hypothetical protein
MKKTLVVISALIALAACAAPPTNRDATSSANANVATSPSPVALTEAEAIAKEKAIWDTIKIKDYDAFAATLATDQVEVMSEGVMDKEATVAGVKQFEPSEVIFSDWKYLPIDNDAFVVTYHVVSRGKFQGKEFPEQKARCSSAWVNRQGKWLAFYHQETPVKPATPPPPPGKSDATKAASPTATPAPPPATGPDPIANEKIVWDLFKSKNYDAFAALVAPNFIEVAADNTYDRAGTIKGVTTFDASKAVLSDWKAANLDDDAALVTYTVKGPAPFAPEGERHSTIWGKRGGKWLVLLHHGGTPVRKPAPAPPAASPAGSPALK